MSWGLETQVLVLQDPIESVSIVQLSPQSNLQRAASVFPSSWMNQAQSTLKFAPYFGIFLMHACAQQCDG